MFSLVENLPKLELDDVNKLVTLTKDLLGKFDQFTNNCSFVVQEVYLRCITCLWLQLDELHFDFIEPLYISTRISLTNLDQYNKPVGCSMYLESATLFLFSIGIKAHIEYSTVIYNILKNKIQCETTFEILSVVLSDNPIELSDNVKKLITHKYWDQKVLNDQIMANESIIELICQKCLVIDSLIDSKYSVLSSFTPALQMYFKLYETIDSFISKVFNLRRDIEISRALLCINRYLSSFSSLVSNKVVLFVFILI